MIVTKKKNKPVLITLETRQEVMKLKTVAEMAKKQCSGQYPSIETPFIDALIAKLEGVNEN